MGLDQSQVDSMVDYFRGIMGERYVSTSIFERIKSGIDIFPHSTKQEILPYVVVLPENAQQVSAVVKYANENKIPVFARGSGTSLHGAARPHTSGIMINTRRLNSYDIVKKHGYVECGVGIRIQEMSTILNKDGYFLPMWTGSKLFASIGGIAANNTSGHIVDAAIGKPSDFILGLEAVLPTGEIIETGTVGLRRPAGTDLTKFFVGSDGLLGIITKVRVRLVPMFKEAYGFALFEDLETLARGVQQMFWDNIPLPLLMEFMSKESAKIGYDIMNLDPPPGPVLLIMATGHTQGEADYKMDQIINSIRKCKPTEAFQIKDIDYWHKILLAREHMVNYAMQSADKRMLLVEVVSPLGDLVEAMNDCINYEKDSPPLQECEKILMGHIGGLTIHPVFLFSMSWGDEKLRTIVDEAFRIEGEINNKYLTCGGEWGQFSKRTEFFKMRYGDFSYDLVRRIKQLFDPNNIMNPGVLEGYR